MADLLLLRVILCREHFQSESRLYHIWSILNIKLVQKGMLLVLGGSIDPTVTAVIMRRTIGHGSMLS